MSRSTLNMTDSLLDYIAEFGVREHPVQARCRQETGELEMAIMQISPEQGAFMQMLVRIMNAKRCIEVGVFTGYSSLSVALALPDDGHITALDVSEEWTAKARGYWKEAGVADKIDLCIAPATESLKTMIGDGEAGTYDFAFIDADKTSYDDYYEACLTLLRSGGLIAIDNVLWSGAVADRDKVDDNTVALRALNEKIHGDNRVDMGLAPIGDGVMLVTKR